MTQRIKRTALLLISFALLGACGGDPGLSARGFARAQQGDAQSGFEFAQDTRLDDGDMPAADRITGSCELRRMGTEEAPAWGVVVDIQRGTSDDLGLSSITLMQRSDAPLAEGRVEASLGGSLFTNGAGACTVELPYVTGTMVGVSASCQVEDAAGETAQISVELDLVGCNVTQ